MQHVIWKEPGKWVWLLIKPWTDSLNLFKPLWNLLKEEIEIERGTKSNLKTTQGKIFFK